MLKRLKLESLVNIINAPCKTVGDDGVSANIMIWHVALHEHMQTEN